jgi:hypothetical protein
MLEIPFSNQWSELRILQSSFALLCCGRFWLLRIHGIAFGSQGLRNEPGCFFGKVKKIDGSPKAGELRMDMDGKQPVGHTQLGVAACSSPVAGPRP